MPPNITLRPPPALGPLQPDFKPPPIDWLSGTWHLTHSTLSMWKSNRNNTITYTVMHNPSTQSPSTKLEDTTCFQALKSSKTTTINGISTAREGDTSVWDWRGKGWLKIATSHFEILGHGDIAEEDGGPGQWFVTYFTATLFTNSGISIFERRKEGNGEAWMREILKGLGEIENEAVKKLAGEIFEVLRD